LVTPLGHDGCGLQAIAGHAVPGGMLGGTQPGFSPPQSQAHGGQFIVFGSQPGQLHAQPPPVPPPPVADGD
jgi:hypothetical protein